MIEGRQVTPSSTRSDVQTEVDTAKGKPPKSDVPPPSDAFKRAEAARKEKAKRDAAAALEPSHDIVPEDAPLPLVHSWKIDGYALELFAPVQHAALAMEAAPAVSNRTWYPQPARPAIASQRPPCEGRGR
jgi:hypothetical protein